MFDASLDLPISPAPPSFLPSALAVSCRTDVRYADSFSAFPVTLPSPSLPADARPPLGCLLLVQRCFCSLLPGALADLSDWVAPTRLKVAQLLHVLVLHQETAVTQHLQKLAPPLTAALADDQQEVVHWVSGGGELGER